jgi:uncharacterized protein (TIGR02099 family)
LFSSSRQAGFVLRLTYLLLTLFFHVAIFFVALVGLANFWLPMVGDYKDVLEQELSSFVGNQISIGMIRVDRSSASPRWVMENLQLTEPSGFAPIHIRRLTLTMDMRESLRTLRPQPGDIHIEGVEFILTQKGQDLPQVEGLTFPLPGQSNTALKIERESPIRVDIDDGTVHWKDDANQQTVALKNLQFVGEFLPDAITIQADAQYPQEIGESLGLDMTMQRDAASGEKEPEWGGNLHVRTRVTDIAKLPSILLKRYGVKTGSLVLDANITAQAGKPLHVSGEGEVSALGFSGTRQVPALDNIDATFKADNDGGKVAVKVRDSELVYPWFEKPLKVDAMDANLQWQVKDDGWYWQLTDVQARNPDADAKGAGTLEALVGKAPDIDLRMTFETRRTVDNVRNYIPAIMPKATEDWLKHAIVAGYVPRGEFVLKGNPADFPFDGKPGEFDIRFDVEKGTLAYLPEWPEAHEVQGELRFHNAGMSARVKSARIMDLAVTGGTVDIPDMLGETHLLLDLQTQGDLYGHMDYLQQAPIGRSLHDFMQAATFSGDSNLRLKLDVPLDGWLFKKKGVSVDGLVTLHDNTFAIPGYGQLFRKLNGEVHFDQYGVSTEKASGEYRGQPVRISAATGQDKSRIKVNLQQRNSPAAFLPEAVQWLGQYMQGKADLNTTLDMPAFNFKAGKKPPSLKVHAESQLQGVEIRLPAPLGKPAQESRNTLVDLDIPFDSAAPWQTSIQVGKQVEVKANLPGKGKGRAAVSIGLGKPAPALAKSGITLEGHLPDVDLLALQGMLSGSASGKSRNPLAGMPIQLSMTAGSLRLGKLPLGNASLDVHGQDTLQASLQAERMRADMTLPVGNMRSGHIGIDLKDLDLAALGDGVPAAGEGGSYSPSAFPALHIGCENCSYGDLLMQSAQLDMDKIPQGLQLKNLQVRTPDLNLSSHDGRWYDTDKGTSHTRIKASVHIPEPGRLLADKGKPSALDKGDMQVSADVDWPGAPFSFALADMGGEASVTLGKGSFTEVDPGLGRLLGLLDVKHLGNRLQMDFRDMTGKGLAFDSINGHVRFNQGQLATQDMVIRSPVMVAGVSGSSDLVRKTHDQTVTVIPNFRSTLPVLGAAVGGIGGGAAMLLFNSLTEKDAAAKLKSAGGFRYHIGGSWDNPQVTELKTALKPPQGKADVDVFVH